MLSTARWLLLILVGSLPLVQPFSFRVRGLELQPADIIFIPLLICFGLFAIRRKVIVEWKSFYLVLAIYAAAFALSAIFAAEPAYSALKLAGVFYLIGLAVVTSVLCGDRAFRKHLVFAWLFGTALTVFASAAAVVLFYAGLTSPESNILISHFGSLPAGNYPRIHALFSNANMMCNYLNVSLVIIFVSRRQNWINEPLAIVLTAGTWLAAILTFSPGLGGLAFSSGVWYWAVHRQAKYRNRCAVVLAAAVFSAILIFGATLVSPDTQNTDRDLSLPILNLTVEPSVRVLVWADASARIAQHPLLGAGPGAATASVYYKTLSGQSQMLSDAHNMWLNVAGQTGFLGLASLLLLGAYLASKCAFRTDDLTDDRVLRIGLSCALIGAFLYQGMSGSFEDARHLWIVFGFLAATPASRLDEDVGPPPTAPNEHI
ncbi:MAG TPA: O-antigen ligase family protein [Pyrinomonadaceae bacterium]|nr:O-antigen ligase family protein [Pyrinomonadaceae bacterium]